MKKALLLGQFVSKPWKGIARGVKEGFESLGYETYPVEFQEANDLKDIMEKILEIKPDIIFCQAIIDRGKFKPLDTTSMLNHLKKVLNFKLVYQEGDYKDIKERISADMSMFDLILFNQDYQLDEHAEFWNIDRKKCVVFPYASFQYTHPPKDCFFTPSNFNVKYPLVFIGTTGDHYTFRNKVLEVLRNVVTIKPKDRNVEGVNYYRWGEKVYANSEVSLSVDYVQDIKHFSSDRPFKIMGAGGLCLCHRANGLDEIFKGKKHCIFFDTPEGASILNGELAEHDWNVGNIRKDAFEYVQKYHTWKNRISDMIKILDGENDHIVFTLKEIYG